MRYQLIQRTKSSWEATSRVDVVSFIEAVEALGHKHKGWHRNPNNRIELQGQPTFQGLCGPMWGGDEGCEGTIRYETVEAYAELST